MCSSKKEKLTVNIVLKRVPGGLVSAVDAAFYTSPLISGALPPMALATGAFEPYTGSSARRPQRADGRFS